MNINEFVACRTPELERFVNILQQEKNSIPLRLRTPHPIRPAAFTKISPKSASKTNSSIDKTNGDVIEPIRAIKHSPFRNCGQFLENTSMAFMRARKKRKVLLSITDELKEKIILKKNRRTRTVTIDLSKQNEEQNNMKKRNKLEEDSTTTATKFGKSKRKQQKEFKLQKKLSQMKRRRAKRALQRGLAVCRFGFRFVLDRATGARRTRVYMPCHRFLSKRFKFVDTSNNNSKRQQDDPYLLKYDSHITSSPHQNIHSFFDLYPALRPQLSLKEQIDENNKRIRQRGEDENLLPYNFSLRVPHSSFSSKTYKRVQKAKTTATCAIFDLSYSLSTMFLGTISSSDDFGKSISDLIKKHFVFTKLNNNSKKQKNSSLFTFNSIKPLGDGVCFASHKNNNPSSCSFVSLLPGLNLLLVSSSSSNKQSDCFAVFDHSFNVESTSCSGALIQFRKGGVTTRKEKKHIKFSDDEEEPQTQNHQDHNNNKNSSSPYVLMIEGLNSKEKAEAMVSKNINNNGVMKYTVGSKGNAVSIEISTSIAVVSLSSSASPSNSKKTLILDLPSSSLSSSIGGGSDFHFPTHYRKISRIFRDSVVVAGCVPGGVRDL